MNDIDKSEGIKGKKSIEKLGAELIDYIIKICNGEKIATELYGLSDINYGSTSIVSILMMFFKILIFKYRH
jgi:altronate dehydratase